MCCKSLRPKAQVCEIRNNEVIELSKKLSREVSNSGTFFCCDVLRKPVKSVWSFRSFQQESCGAFWKNTQPGSFEFWELFFLRRVAKAWESLRNKFGAYKASNKEVAELLRNAQPEGLEFCNFFCCDVLRTKSLQNVTLRLSGPTWAFKNRFHFFCSF